MIWLLMPNIPRSQNLYKNVPRSNLKVLASKIMKQHGISEPEITAGSPRFSNQNSVFQTKC